MTLATRLRSVAIDVTARARVFRHVPELSRGKINAARLLEQAAERFPDRPALLFLDERHTWADFHREASRWARFFLARGVVRGDVVAVLMDNRSEYVFALLGLSMIRATAACVNSHVAGHALAHALRIVSPRFVLVGSEHERAMRDVDVDPNLKTRARLWVHRDRDAESEAPAINEELAATSTRIVDDPSHARIDEPASYLYTSGTTGLPKAAKITNQRSILASLGFGKVFHDATEEDVIYVALPLYHGNAQWGGLGACLATGAALALRRKFSASAFFTDAVRFGATRMMYIGELCRYLVLSPDNPDERRHRIRMAVGNGLRKDVWEAFSARFRIPVIREFYGATEGNSPIINLEGRPGMLGRLVFGQALIACDPQTGDVERDERGHCVRRTRASDHGLLVARISATARFDGYADANATNAKILRNVFRDGDAWFNSGDVLELHDDGWVSFVDRVGDTFRWKGENVSTNEVAEALNRAAGVVESNVYGVTVGNAEGRAGMASLRVTADFSLDAFAAHVMVALPRYARPLFLRLDDAARTTGTFKYQKTDYQRDGFDPDAVRRPLFALVDGAYRPLDRELFRRIQSGDLAVG